MRRTTSTIAALVLVGSTLAPRAENEALFIELPSGTLPSAVGAGGSIVVGGLRTGGGFYWMPTTGTVYIGGVSANDVSRDGRMTRHSRVNRVLSGVAVAAVTGATPDIGPLRQHPRLVLTIDSRSRRPWAWAWRGRRSPRWP